METVQKADRLDAPVYHVEGRRHLVLPQPTPTAAFFIENLCKGHVSQANHGLSAQEVGMASRLRYVSLRTVNAIKGDARMEGLPVLVLTMLVGFMLVGWVYSWIVTLLFEDSKRL